ncbi:MAG: DUF2934 domain-containing protein [Solirubrobacteraceae bacterium]
MIRFRAPGFILALAGTASVRISLIESKRGMVTPTDRIKRRRWTDVAIESELRAQCAALGHFPTRSELVSRGFRSLWDATRSSGGADVWRERVDCGSPAVLREQIAVRAYQLYTQGFPGDAEAHWLAAEQELETQSKR